MSSSDVLPLNLDDDNPILDCNNDMDTVQVLWINTSKLTSNQLAEYAELPGIVLPSIPTSAPDFSPAVKDSVTININTVVIDSDLLEDSNQVCGQSDNEVNATVTNLLVFIHSYKGYDCKFKCLAKLTGTVGLEQKVQPLGVLYLRILAFIPCVYLANWYFYSPHLSYTLASPWDVLKTAKN